MNEPHYYEAHVQYDLMSHSTHGERRLTLETAKNFGFWSSEVTRDDDADEEHCFFTTRDTDYKRCEARMHDLVSALSKIAAVTTRRQKIEACVYDTAFGG